MTVGIKRATRVVQKCGDAFGVSPLDGQVDWRPAVPPDPDAALAGLRAVIEEKFEIL